MKVYIYTADDIEDHYPLRAFATEEKALSFFGQAKQAQIDAFVANGGKAERWDERYFYGDVVEMEVE